MDQILTDSFIQVLPVTFKSFLSETNERTEEEIPSPRGTGLIMRKFKTTKRLRNGGYQLPNTANVLQENTWSFVQNYEADRCANVSILRVIVL